VAAAICANNGRVVERKLGDQEIGMVALLIGTFVIGVIGGVLLRLLQFLFVLSIAIAIGSAVAAAQGQPILEVLTSCVGLLCFGQIGYAAGLGLRAGVGFLRNPRLGLVKTRAPRIWELFRPSKK
jgi:hypothetical protein